MAADVKSKNLYELLGNTSDQDSDREPDPPTKTVDRAAPRHGKRDAPKAAPSGPTDVATRGRGGNRNGGFTGNEAAFRDRATGRNRNREQPTEDGAGARPRGRGRGGPRRGGDRHSRTGIGEHPKQEGHGWGEQTGEGELADEKAGDAIASQEIKEETVESGEAGTAPADTQPEAEPEPEDKNKSYADYLAEQAAKKLGALGLKEARAPNEGTKEDKKWKNAKELTRAEDAEYFVGEERKGGKEKVRKDKNILDLDHAWNEQARESRGRGGRGRGSRGDFRGERGERGERSERPERPERTERGDFRGRGRGRGDRGEFRGRGRGRGSDAPAVAVNDENAFPSLGSK